MRRSVLLGTLGVSQVFRLSMILVIESIVHAVFADRVRSAQGAIAPIQRAVTDVPRAVIAQTIARYH